MGKTNNEGENALKTWRGYAGDIAAIVIGILLALSADTAWQYRLDRNEEQQIIEALTIEFSADIEEIEEDHRFRRKKLESMKLLNELRKNPTQAIRGDTLAVAFRDLLRSRFYAPNHAILDDVLSTGRLELIRAEKLRRSIMIFEHNRATQTILENPARDYARQRLRLYLASHLDLESYLSNTSGELLEATDVEPLSEILSDKEFGSLLYLSMVNTLAVHGHSERLLESVRAVREALDQELRN